MSTFDEVTSGLAEVGANISALDAKLDEVRAFISALQVGTVVTQEQLDALAAVVGAAKDASAAVLAETDALDS